MTYESTKADIIQALNDQYGIKYTGANFSCIDPGHKDVHPSANIFEIDGKCRVKCQSCGGRWDLADLIGKPKKLDKQPKTMTKEQTKAWLTGIGPIEEVHKYIGLSGTVLMYEARLKVGQGKEMRPFYPLNGGFVKGERSKPWPLWNQKAISDAPIVAVCEGVKAASAVNQVMSATTSPFGAPGVSPSGKVASSKAQYTDWSILKGKKVILWPDNDPGGLRHMQDVREILLELGCTIGVVDVSKMDYKGDAADIDLNTAIQMMDKVVFEEYVDPYIKDNEDIISGKKAPIKTPWPFFARNNQAFIPGTVTCLYGAGGSRKTFFLFQLMSAMIEAGQVPAFLGLEMTRNEYIDRIIVQRTGEKGLLEMEWKEENPELIRKLQKENESHYLKILKHLTLGGRDLYTCDKVVDWAEALHDDVVVAIVDPVSFIETKEVWNDHKRLVNSLRRIAEKKCMSVILSNHTSKNGLDMAGGNSLKTHTDATYRFYGQKKEDFDKKTTCAGLSYRMEYDIHNFVEIEKGRKSKMPGHTFGFEVDEKIEFIERGYVIE